MVNSLLIACYEWFGVFDPLEMSILYNLWHFFSFEHEKWQQNKFEMVSNSFYQIHTRYFHLSDKFEWLFHYFLHFIFDYFGFQPPWKANFDRVASGPHKKKIGPTENSHFFVFYESTYSTLRKCRNWTCVFW